MSNSSDWISWGIPLIVVLGVIFLFVVFVLVARWHIRRPQHYAGTARIDGKTVIITGGNTGIGKETAKELLKRGGKVIILCRDTHKGRVAAEEISEESGSPVLVHHLDLASLKSVRECAALLKETEPNIHILINNAGVMCCPEGETEDGFETHFGTNHLGHFLLTLLLLDNIKAAAPSRIITVASLAHKYGIMNWEDLNGKRAYDPTKAYAQSKLANVLFTKGLAQKLEGTGVTTYAVHPGVVLTDLGRHLEASLGVMKKPLLNAVKPLLKTPRTGALTTIFCAVDPSVEKDSGKYYSGCEEKQESSQAQSKDDAERLWKASLEMVDLKDPIA